MNSAINAGQSSPAERSWKQERGSFICQIANMQTALRRSRGLTMSWRAKWQATDRRAKMYAQRLSEYALHAKETI